MERAPRPRPAENAIDRLIESAYGEAFEEVGRKVDAVYRELGAKVVSGISYAGESTTTLFVPAEQSEAMAAFGNRPA